MTPTEDRYQNFVTSFLSLSRIFSYAKDSFWQQKIYDRLINLSTAFINFEICLSRGTQGNVAQSTEFGRLISSIDSCFELIELLEHYNEIGVTPLFGAKRSTLNFKLKLLASLSREQKQQERIVEKAPRVDAEIPRQVNKLNSNKERVLEFIKTTGEARTKDIISVFPNISERTVKRALKELLSLKLVVKKVKDNGVFYSAVP